MKYLLIFLSISLLFSQELEVEGDLKVTGTVESTTIDSMQAVIDGLQVQIGELQANINTRIYEIEQVFNPFQLYNYYWSDILGFELDEGRVGLLSISSSDTDDFGSAQIQFSDGRNIGLYNYSWYDGALEFEDGSNELFIQTRDHLDITVSSEYNQPINFNIKLAITAQFPD